MLFRSFIVEGVGKTDSAIMDVVQTPRKSTPYAGETLTFDISILNDGDNILENCEFKITVPQSSSLEQKTGTLVGSKNISNKTLTVPATIHTYAIEDITSFSYETITMKATISLPVDVIPDSTDISFELLSNGKSISTANTSITILARTNGVLELFRYNQDTPEEIINIKTTQYDDGNGFVTITPPPLPDNSSVSVIDQPVPLSISSEFRHGQTLFLRVTDRDQNSNINAPDTIDIDLAVSNTNDAETVRLTETGNNSGIFTGYISISLASGGSKDGILNVTINEQLAVSYTDDIDNSDQTAISVLIDPYGVIFDSATGELLNGFSVRLVNATTGQDAVVYGDDGVSIYDSTIISGGIASDSSGTTYDFPDGNYRFPFIAPGDYYLEISPPPYYIIPSDKENSLFTKLPNGPFVVDIGSRGETFTLIAGPPLHLDIPADPYTSPLYVRRTASKEEVAQGDFIQFRVSVENISTAMDMNEAVLTDLLPQGFAYQKGSARIDDVYTTDPESSSDGRILTFRIGTLAKTSTYNISYVAAIGASKSGIAESNSVGEANGGAVKSNNSLLRTKVKEAFMRDRRILMGRVIAHDEDGNPTEEGLPGVRIYMENGTFTVTDNKGRYHFEGVTPGTHVIQLDLDTLPKTYEAIPFVKNTRFAGRAWSKFIDLQGGTLWRADFHAILKPKRTGNLKLQLSNDELSGQDRIRYRIKMQNKIVPLYNLRMMVLLPEGVSYQSDSTLLSHNPIADPQINERMLTYRLNDIEADFNGDLTFEINVSDKKARELITKAMLMFDSPDEKDHRSLVLEHLIIREIIYKETIEKPYIINFFEFVLQQKFESLSSKITEDAKKELDLLVENLSDLKNIRISATGHSDNSQIRLASRMFFADNQQLSEKRALSVANYLRDNLGITPERIVVIGKGSSEPVADNDTVEGRAANRRVELFIVGDDADRRAKLVNKGIRSEPLKIDTIGKRPGEAAIQKQFRSEEHTSELQSH